MKKCVLRLLITSTLLASFLFFSFRMYERSTDGFDVAHITYQGSIRPEWEMPALDGSQSALLDQILQSPFDYIGKGAQSYVFGSREGNYVIKFFKFKHLRPHWYVEILPSFSIIEKYRKRSADRKERLIAGVFAGHQLAYKKHRKESGLLFLVLTPSIASHKHVVLYDKIGREWNLSLEHIPFVIQERVETTRTVMRRALAAGDLALAKDRFSQIATLYRSEYAKGIYDRDHGVLHNTGFIGARPIHLDVGKLTEKSEMKEEIFWRPDLKLMAERFLTWIEKEYPQYKEELSFHVWKEIQK